MTVLSWAEKNQYLILTFVLMVLVVFVLLRFQVHLREKYAGIIHTLMYSDPALCAERLENNRLFPLIFRRPLLELWKLGAFMQLGQNQKIEQSIVRLRKLKLQPRDKLDFYQKTLSYYALTGNRDAALQCRNDLYAFIHSVKAEKLERYAAILEESDIIIGVYVEHNTALIKKLIGRAEHTKNNVMRGILQYRIAKLAWFKNDSVLCETYLNRAEKNLKGTAYQSIIESAKENPEILAEK